MQVLLDHALIVLGLLLAILAALSGWLRTAVLSTSILAVAGGAALAGLGAISSRPGSALIVSLVELTLILTLFRDGLEVEPELLRRRWRAPLRALAVAMPLTLGLIAVPAHLLLGLGWPRSLLLGAILMPTDPVITATIVDSPGVPRLVRHTLNVESGLNDGLALPFVVVLIAIVDGGGGAAGAGGRMAGESAAGVAIGAAIALAPGGSWSGCPSARSQAPSRASTRWGSRSRPTAPRRRRSATACWRPSTAASPSRSSRRTSRPRRGTSPTR